MSDRTTNTGSAKITDSAVAVGTGGGESSASVKQQQQQQPQLQDAYTLQHSTNLIDKVHHKLQLNTDIGYASMIPTTSTTPTYLQQQQQQANIDTNDNIDQYSDTDEYVDIHTARKQQNIFYGTGAEYNNNNDNNTVLTAANVHNNDIDNMYGDSNNIDHDATVAVHEMHLTLLYMMSNPVEFEKCIIASQQGGDPLYHRQSSHSQQQYRQSQGNMASWVQAAAAADDLSLNTETTDFSIQQPSSPNRTTTTTTATTLTSIIEDGFSNMMMKPKPNTVTTRNDSSSDVLLPHIIFCDDAEIVLPQAHTASQLFGMELVSGIELEAASGILPICQLFLRWLALMPSGDHLHIIDPPGLTVMRIAGGRYRVTAAHRVVWTWMNEFFISPLPIVQQQHRRNQQQQAMNTATTTSSNSTASLDTTTTSSRPNNNNSTNNNNNSNTNALQMGDLVGMTIVDVFESDHSGKLLSYCPTFDNRAIYKIDRTTYQIRKQTSTAMKGAIQKVIQTSQIASAITKYTTNFASQVHQRVTGAVQQYNQPQQNAAINPATASVDDDEEEYGDEDEEQDVITIATTSQHLPPALELSSPNRTIASESTSVYHGDEDNERQEV